MWLASDVRFPLFAGQEWCPSRAQCFLVAANATARSEPCCADWTDKDQCAGDLVCGTGANAVCGCTAGEGSRAVVPWGIPGWSLCAVPRCACLAET